MAGDDYYIWATLDRENPKAGCGDAHEAFQALLQAKGEIVTLNLADKLASFRRRYPDTSRTFGVDEFGAAVGLSRAGVNHWMQRGCCEPDIAPRSGRGRRRRWSWRLTFLGWVLSNLSARGIGVDVLAAIAKDFTRAGRRRKVPV